MTYFRKVFIAFDQFINALIGGYPDETFSSRCYRWDMNGYTSIPRKVVDTLLFFDKDHCYSSFLSERNDRHLPPECRNECRNECRTI